MLLAPATQGQGRHSGPASLREADSEQSHLYCFSGWMSPAYSWPPSWASCASSPSTATWYLRRRLEMTGV
ncbi:agouti, isoform CRA_a [Rattus norvegicus]|uniref:Agouti, isoform CRA_a n=1 Tax=Rattus norvegicus TaxID=10116 RepID=A6KI12_RAT|nr:agouti, isoform CRA_a [Rattus norvegicus]